MKVQSNTKPKTIEIKHLHNAAILIFSENVVEEVKIDVETKDEATLYTYDEYRLTVPQTANLEQRVKGNEAQWLAKAKQVELDKLAKEVREKRNQLLAETDYMFLADQQLPVEKESAMKEYRQKLRDISKQQGFPKEVIFPEVAK